MPCSPIGEPQIDAQSARAGSHQGRRIPLAVALILASSAAFAQPVRPDPRVTPGALNAAVTPANIGETICRRGWTRTVRPDRDYAGWLKHRLLDGTGYAARSVVLDHDVPLELGGAPDDPRNLWLEPREGEWGADRKDELEDKLRELVCAGRVPLGAAQAAIASDWIAAWHQYVGRDE